MKDKEDRPVRRHLNAEQKLALRAAEIARFTKQYGRKAQKGMEPNDRRFDSDKIHPKIKRMKPEVLDRLIRDDEQ